MTLATGYFSNDSLLYLLKLAEMNETKRIDVILGMAYFEGVSKSQFEAATKLNAFLEGEQTGSLKVVRTFPFHGKLYSFESYEGRKTSLVGSSNLSNIVPLRGIEQRNYEVDIEILEDATNQKITRFLEVLKDDASVPFDSIATRLTIHANENPLLNFRSDVERVTSPHLSGIQEKLAKVSFHIPLKDAPKSNLNVYFGKGRENQQGYVAPRPWYEVEIIVDQATQRSAPNYPENRDFIAYTDDGYRMAMKTSGDYGKNLRSKYDLSILGRWIKGRLETSGCLKAGESVTDEVLESYGRNHITLTQTSLLETEILDGEPLEVWYMDFAPLTREKQ